MAGAACEAPNGVRESFDACKVEPFHNNCEAGACSVARQSPKEATTDRDDREAKPRWADFADADSDDEVSGPSLRSKPRTRWADLVDSEDETAINKSQPSQQQPPAEPVTETPSTDELTKQTVHAVDGRSVVPQAGRSAAEGKENIRAQQRSGGRIAETKAQRPTDGKAHTSEGREGKKPRGHPATREVRSNGERHGGQWTAREWAEWREQQAAKANQPQRESRGQHQRAGGKRQCQFDIGIVEDSKFGVVRRLLGSRGANVKAINEATGAKLRLRGRGSKFLEGPEQRESEDPLMLCVSIPDPATYDDAVRLISELLEDIYSEYRSFCSGARIPVPDLRIQMHEGAREGAR